MDVWGGFAIKKVDFTFPSPSFPLVINAWEILSDEFDGRTRRTADPTQPSVYRGFLARVGGLSAAATLSTIFFVLFPLEVRDKRIV